MSNDSVVEELRAAREEYAKRFNYDLRAIVQDLREQAQKKGLKLVSLPPRRLERAEPAPVRR
jgi:hypothetical protein